MSLLLAGALRDDVGAFFEAAATDVDAARRDTREGLRFIAGRVLDADAPLEAVARTIASVAWSDLASAFSLWCHRMVLVYLAGHAERAEVAALRRFGSTGLAAAMAHHVSGAPLPIEARADGDTLILDGKVRWASNLFAPDFLLVTATRVGVRAAVVVLRGETAGLRVDPYPDLLALQATASSSLTLAGARVEPAAIVNGDLSAFVARVRPTFLALQSSFCWGLARRALDEARAPLAGAAALLAGEHDALEARAETLAEAVVATANGNRPRERELVRVRLEAARLAVEAVALEAKAVGSRGFARSSATARRLREAAFLPIQAPTEVQLRAELARAEPVAAPA